MDEGQVTMDIPSTDGTRPAHKRNAEGTIPPDWSLRPLREIAPLQRGFDLPTSQIRSGPHPVVYSNGVLQNHERAMIKGPGVVTGRSGTIGKVHFIENDYWPHNTTLWVTSFLGNDPEFIYYLYTHLDLSRFLSGSGVPTLNRNDVHRSLAVNPPPSEQRAIAEALSDVDRLIESLESLIAKKRSIKQATMQQLLTGKTRLPGFSEKWETRRLGSLGMFLKGRGIKREDISDTGFPCIRYGELYTRYENYILNAVARIPSSIAELALPIKTGDLLFAGSGETSEEIGRCAAYLGDESAFAGGDVVVLTYLDQNSLYLGYLMNNPTVAKQKARMSQGDAVVHINARSLAQIDIDLPPVEEQAAIAAILSDMDAEIAALERRFDKTRTLKQGMMQQLLTGKIRLIESIETTTRRASATSTERKHNWQFNEAVVIAVLTKHFGDKKYPLSRTRYTKLSYLLHRHSEGRADGYLKKAAGPYNPSTRYGGPEKIALTNDYVCRHKSDKYSGFIVGENVEQAEIYFVKWYGEDCLKWLNQFRYETRDDLELLTTVDLAIEELREAGKAISVEDVRKVIHSDPEWKAKLNRPVFSNTNITRVIEKCRRLFGVRDERPKT